MTTHHIPSRTNQGYTFNVVERKSKKLVTSFNKMMDAREYIEDKPDLVVMPKREITINKRYFVLDEGGKIEKEFDTWNDAELYCEGTDKQVITS